MGSEMLFMYMTMHFSKVLSDKDKLYSSCYACPCALFFVVLFFATNLTRWLSGYRVALLSNKPWDQMPTWQSHFGGGET